MKKYLFLALAFALPLFNLAALEEEVPEEPSAIEFNQYLQDALANHKWWDAIDLADLMVYNFPISPFANELSYFSGYAYFQLDQYELANEMLSEYLNHSLSHSHFEEAIQMKFEIAEAFLHGKKKRLFGSHKMPAWLSAKEDALAIYDEVVAMVPHTDMASQSLLSKAQIQLELEDFKPAVETLSLLIRRFPKHEAAAEAYLCINKVYLRQSQLTSLDLDILDLSAVNLRKFRLAFPRELRLQEAEKVFAETEELFANNLLDTGQFFERTHKTAASIIYYNKVVAKYPETKAASFAQKRLDALPKDDSSDS